MHMCNKIVGQGLIIIPLLLLGVGCNNKAMIKKDAPPPPHELQVFTGRTNEIWVDFIVQNKSKASIDFAYYHDAENQKDRASFALESKETLGDISKKESSLQLVLKPGNSEETYYVEDNQTGYQWPFRVPADKSAVLLEISDKQTGDTSSAPFQLVFSYL